MSIPASRSNVSLPSKKFCLQYRAELRKDSALFISARRCFSNHFSKDFSETFPRLSIVVFPPSHNCNFLKQLRIMGDSRRPALYRTTSKERYDRSASRLHRKNTRHYQNPGALTLRSRQPSNWPSSSQEKRIADQIILTETPAPPFHEEERAKVLLSMFKQYGLTDVKQDAIGQRHRPRKGTGSGPTLVMGAHIDTVFPAVPTAKFTETGDVYAAPGISVTRPV